MNLIGFLNIHEIILIPPVLCFIFPATPSPCTNSSANGIVSGMTQLSANRIILNQSGAPSDSSTIKIVKTVRAINHIMGLN